MERKRYNVTIGAPRGESEFEIHLTDAEADTVRFFAEQIEAAAGADGSVDYIEIEAAE